VATITTVSTVWSKAGDGSDPTSRDVQLAFDGEVIKMVGGPTGWESFRLADWLAYPTADGSWPACAGTPGRWASCIVPAAEMSRALRELGAIA
jgi:hypothetical protein